VQPSYSHLAAVKPTGKCQRIRHGSRSAATQMVQVMEEQISNILSGYQPIPKGTG
jgi:hypothetical protein